MKSLLRLTAILGLLVLTPMGWGMTSASAQASCQATVDAVAREIRKKGTNVDVYVYPGGDSASELGNTTRIGSVVYGMSGVGSSNRQHSVASNILHSKVLMKSYASRVFANCGGTGIVSFGENNSDWLESFGMTDNGTLAYEQCAQSPQELRNRLSSVWGPYQSSYCAYVIPNF